MLSLGIDIGSTTSKCALMNENLELIDTLLIKSGTGTDGPSRVFQEILDRNHLVKEDLDCIIATGYGRLRFEDANDQISELSAHALGIHYLIPEAKTIIDIGGQDVKVLKLSDQGKLLNFVMNDKCSAGTGRFLDVMAAILQMDVNDLGDEALSAEKVAPISSTCTVFAESEVISQLSNGVKRDEIIAGICESVATKTATLVHRAGLQEKVAMSGGVSKNKGVVHFLEEKLQTKIYTSEFAQCAGAIGASIYGLNHK